MTLLNAQQWGEVNWCSPYTQGLLACISNGVDTTGNNPFYVYGYSPTLGVAGQGLKHQAGSYVPPFSLGAFIATNGTPQTSTPIFGFYFGSSNIYFQWSSPTTSGLQYKVNSSTVATVSGNFTGGAWIWFVCTAGGSASLWCNGVSESTQSIGTPSAAGSVILMNGTNNFSPLILSYNRALSGSMINAIQNDPAHTIFRPLGRTKSVLYAAQNYPFTPTQGALTLTGTRSNLGISVLPVVGSLSLTGIAGANGIGAVVNAGALSLLGANGNLGLGTTPVFGSIAVTGANSSLGFGFIPASGILNVAGNSSLLGFGSSPLSGSLTLTGKNSSLGIGATVNTGVVSVSGQIVSLGAGLTPPPGSLLFTGYFPTETHGSAPITVLFLPQYQMSVRVSPQRIVDANGPLRWTLNRIDGLDVSLPSSAVMNVELPDGTTSTGTVSIEAGVSEPVIYLDGQYSYTQVGMYRVTLLVTMPDGTVIGNAYTVDYEGYVQ